MSIKPDIIIAADGPLTKTAKAYGFYDKRRKNYYGIQAVVEGDFENAHAYEAFFSENLCPDLFVWLVPESKTTARVGLASKTHSKSQFDSFMRKYNYKVLQMQGGTIPIYFPKQKLKHDNCYLLGDAAGQVKATTLGGLIPGMDAAQILVDCINNNKNYHKALLPVRRKLWMHLKIRSVFDKFSDKDWDKLLYLVDQEKVKKIFSTYARDNPIPLVLYTLLREPRFLYFFKYLI